MPLCRLPFHIPCSIFRLRDEYLQILYHLNHFECHMSQRVHSYSQNDHVSHVSRASFGKVKCHKVKKVTNLTENSPKLKTFLRYDGFSSFLARSWVFHALNIRVKCTLIGILFEFCTNVTVTGPVFDHSARYKYVPCHWPFEVIQMVQYVIRDSNSTWCGWGSCTSYLQCCIVAFSMTSTLSPLESLCYVQ